MNDSRGIFAILSLAAGLVLFIAAFRYAFFKQGSILRRKRAFTSLIYGVLFVIAGVLLGSRQGEQVAARQDASPPTERQAASEPATPQPVPPQASQPQSEPAPRDSIVAARRDTTGQQQVAAGRETVPPPVVDSPWEHPIPKPRPIVTALLPAPELKSSQDDQLLSKAPEERIALVVTRAFAAIENFFDKYASPAQKVKAPAGSRMAHAVSVHIQFPRVTFEEETADLTPESELALRRLAKDLAQDPDVSLEIQVRVDSVGPEALNYMLTQARAAAVRDYLVVEGIPAERLIARGFGTQPFPQGTSNLIAFVVRR